MKPRLAAWALLAIAASLTSAPASGPTRHLFLDPAFVREAHGATLRVNPPLRADRVMVPDRPWEQLMITFYTTVRDEGGRLRMWYVCRDRQNEPNVAYAESVDGVSWTRPELGIIEYKGSAANNLVGLQSLEGAVYRDPRGAENERYVYVSTGRGGVFRFTSPDGLRWKRDARPLVRFQPDTQTVVFWDERLSTSAVTRMLIEADTRRDKRAEVVDKLAASYILQGFLDRLRISP